jgi:hypothetical protein
MYQSRCISIYLKTPLKMNFNSYLLFGCLLLRYSDHPYDGGNDGIDSALQDDVKDLKSSEFSLTKQENHQYYSWSTHVYRQWGEKAHATLYIDQKSSTRYGPVEPEDGRRCEGCGHAWDPVPLQEFLSKMEGVPAPQPTTNSVCCSVCGFVALDFATSASALYLPGTSGTNCPSIRAIEQDNTFMAARQVF